MKYVLAVLLLASLLAGASTSKSPSWDREQREEQKDELSRQKSAAFLNVKDDSSHCDKCMTLVTLTIW